MRGDRATGRAWLVWGVAVAVYVAAVFHRGSLGVAGPQALERFDIGPAALGAFTVLQVGIYASMQIPAGLLVDRFGARRILVLSVVLLGLGQLLFALAASYPLALLARALLGVADGMTWVTILRVVAMRFSTRQYALVATVSGGLGGLGGVAATFPFAALLGGLGWTGAFVLVGAVTFGYALVVGVVVRDPGAGARESGPGPSVLRSVGAAWRVPGTRLAFWVHSCTMFVPSVLVLLWGFPYLVEGLGVAPGTASVVLSTLVLGQVVAGPVLGTVISRSPVARLPIVVGFLLACATTWAVLLAWPQGTPPVWFVVLAFAIFAMGGPVSAIAFAVARDYNPVQQVGVASGLANTGGHSATALGAVTVGLILQLGSGLPVADTYRLAMLALVAMLLFGGFRTLVWWRRVRRLVLAAQDRGEDVPVTLRPRVARGTR